MTTTPKNLFQSHIHEIDQRKKRIRTSIGTFGREIGWEGTSGTPKSVDKLAGGAAPRQKYREPSQPVRKRTSGPGPV
jgi:hypothetical protein